jgi:hypothetical protein
MSIPASMGAASALGTMAALSPIDSILHIFNSNPYFIGITMLLMNLGGRFLTLEVSKKQEQFLQHPWVRRSLIFIVIFIGTRSIWVAFWTTLVVVLLMGYLFNENSALCIFGNHGTRGATCSNPKSNESNTDGKADLTPEEKEILQRLMAKSQRMQASLQNDDIKDDVLVTDVYTANMSLLRR